MGITTDLVQQLNRTFVSQRAEKDFYRKKKQELKDFLYNKFYKKFAENEGKPPDNIYSYFLQTDIQTKILNQFNELDLSSKFDIYNSILKKIYNQFKTSYKMNYSTENIEKEEAKQQKELENLNIKYIKAIEKRDRAKKRYFESLANYEKELTKNKKVKKQGFAKIAGALFVGGRIADKTYKKMKY